MLCGDKCESVSHVYTVGMVVLELTSGCSSGKALILGNTLREENF